MQIERDFLNKNSIIYYEIKEKFYSKKNNVYRVDFKCINKQRLNLVVKIFNNTDSKDKEAYILSALKEHGLNVPNILYTGKDSIIIDYLDGPTLLDILCRFEEDCSEHQKLAEDIGRMCAFILTYIPSFTSCKIGLVRSLIDKAVELVNANEKITREYMKD